MANPVEVAEHLLSARRAPTPLTAGLPERLRPNGLTEGYAMQRAYVEAHGGRPIGYKVAATSDRAQAALGTETPFYGHLFDSTSRLDGAAASWPAEHFLVGLVEPEFAVRLAADLPEQASPYDRETVAAAVGSLHPAFEIIDSAYGREDWMSAGAANLIADNAAHGAFLLGPGTRDFSAEELADHKVSLTVDDKLIGSGAGANALGHPFNVLAWLANELIAQGRFLRAGDLVTTGVVTPFVYLESGQAARADFGAFGQISVALSA